MHKIWCPQITYIIDNVHRYLQSKENINVVIRNCVWYIFAYFNKLLLFYYQIIAHAMQAYTLGNLTVTPHSILGNKYTFKIQTDC